MTFIDFVGLSAGACVLTAFYMTDQVWLRRFAIASNVLFLVYAAGLTLWPVAILHAALLPLNVIRLGQIRDPLGSEEFRLGELRREMIEQDVRMQMRGLRHRRFD
ncbi:MAG: hypothetical protein AAF871_05175 [Pseudomonadota bacterium]